MQTVAEIFSLWPSDADFARDIGISYPTASSWKQRGSIPVSYWRPIIRAARKRGHAEITADLLVDIHADRREQATGGFAENDVEYVVEGEPGPDRVPKQSGQAAAGHFSRHKNIRRNRFKSGEEIEEHIRALREEWSDR